MTDFHARSPSPRPGSSVLRGGRQVLAATVVVGGLLAVMWVLEGLDYMLPLDLDQLGIHSWELGGLIGILTVPFLHGDFAHLAANSAPFLVMGILVAMRGLGRFVGASLIIMLVSGLGVWFINAPDTLTVGASGVVFGYFGYLLARGVVERHPLDIAMAVIVGFLYSGMLWGVLPSQAQGISWQGHLFGFVGGIAAAWMLRTGRTARA